MLALFISADGLVGVREIQEDKKIVVYEIVRMPDFHDLSPDSHNKPVPILRRTYERVEQLHSLSMPVYKELT